MCFFHLNNAYVGAFFLCSLLSHKHTGASCCDDSLSWCCEVVSHRKQLLHHSVLKPSQKSQSPWDNVHVFCQQFLPLKNDKNRFVVEEWLLERNSFLAILHLSSDKPASCELLDPPRTVPHLNFKLNLRHLTAFSSDLDQTPSFHSSPFSITARPVHAVTATIRTDAYQSCRVLVYTSKARLCECVWMSTIESVERGLSLGFECN